MDFALNSNRLNSLCSQLAVSEKIKFYADDKIDKVADILFSLTPMAKILVFSAQNTFESLGQSLIDLLKRKKFKPISIVADGESSLSVDDLCGAFNTPEDVRAVIVTDTELFFKAFYFCEVRKLPCIIIATDLTNRGLFTKKILIKNADGMDELACDIERHVFLLEREVQEQEVARAFSFQTASLVALTDYRLYSAVTRETPDKTAYNLARSAILDSFNIIKDKNGLKSRLFYNGMLLELADYLTEGRLISLSAPILTEYLYVRNSKEKDDVTLSSALVIMQAYHKFVASEVKELTFAPNYVNRAKRLSELAGFSEEEILKSFRMQSNRFSARKVKINEYRQKLKEEIIQAERVLGLAMDEWFKLGGSNRVDLSLLDECIKLAGDTPLTINGMSLVREWGIIKES